MKRVIASNNDSRVRKHPKIKAMYDVVKRMDDDLDYLESCDTIEEMENHDYKIIRTKGLIRYIEEYPNEDPSVLMDEWIEIAENKLGGQRERYFELYRNLLAFYNTVDLLKGKLDIELDGEDVAIIPIGGKNPSDLDSLVDLISRAIGGRTRVKGTNLYEIITRRNGVLEVGSIRWWDSNHTDYEDTWEMRPDGFTRIDEFGN